MNKKSNNGYFTAIEGEENSISIATVGHGCLSERQIGFVDKSGNFHFDTDGEQIHVWGENLTELIELIEETIAAVTNKINCPVS